VAVMALIQLGYLVAFAIVAKKLSAVASNTQQQVELLTADVRLRLGTVTDRVNVVADDVRAVTARVQQVALSVADGVQRVEAQVRAAGERVHAAVDQVPSGVKKGVPAGLALLAALRTVQKIRQRLRDDPRGNGQHG
jgi:uncharacterized protein YoxC